MNPLFPSRRLWRTTVTLLLLLSSGFGFAASDPLFWRVQADDKAQGEVYLLGSIHFGHETMYPLPEKVMKAYERTELLAVELDITAVAPAKVAELMLLHGRFPEGENLRNHIGEESWQKLVNVCTELHVNPEGFLPLKPWLVAVQLVSLQIRNTDYDEALGIDRYFLQQARNQKSIYELESIEDQVSIFSQFNDREQALFLRQALDDHSQGPAYLKGLAEAWRGADKKVLEQMVLDAFKGGIATEKMFRLVFSERNLRMTAAVEGFVNRGSSAFVVVGVGHMLGSKGLVAELRRRGYRVERY